MQFGIQQFCLREAAKNKEGALSALDDIKSLGFSGIELNAFMLGKLSFGVRMLCKMAGMPVGSGNVDWKEEVKKRELSVISLHKDLNGILNEPAKTADEAKALGAKYVVVTGMQFLDYSKPENIEKLCEDLNKAGKLLKTGGAELLYHNHNVEFMYIGDVSEYKTPYEAITKLTNPEYVNFEVDTYWLSECGKDAKKLLETLRGRVKLIHICDRGIRATKKTGSIKKSSCTELGTGNIDIEGILDIAEKIGVEYAVLEQTSDFIDKDNMKSVKISAEYLKKYFAKQ